jgi:hemerythrin-like domain-containing protein
MIDNHSYISKNPNEKKKYASINNRYVQQKKNYIEKEDDECTSIMKQSVETKKNNNFSHSAIRPVSCQTLSLLWRF